MRSSAMNASVANMISKVTILQCIPIRNVTRTVTVRQINTATLRTLKELKEPIRRSKRWISEIEMLLASHERDQRRDEALFKLELAEFDKREPQRQWYYDQLKIGEATNEDTQKSSREVK